MAGARIDQLRWAAIAAIILAGLASPGSGPGQEASGPPSTLQDARLRRLREASSSWELRSGPRREVVDVVCLVPDAASFLEAIATWDESHWFPILIEDVEYTPKFLRAFRPARVLRFPSRGRPEQGDALWEKAAAAVGRAWTGADPTAPPGDRPPPPTIRRPPPGVVVSNPAASALPGAVALAAGRFQPLVRWEPGLGFDEMPSQEEAQRLARELQAIVSRGIPDHERLGDDCDFLTLALELPYRYQDPSVAQGGLTWKPGPAALDDLIGRHLVVPQPDTVRIRWAFTGRLLGDEIRSTYAAMCSLFLRPSRAAFFDGYAERRDAFVPYHQGPAIDRLAGLVEVARRPGRREDLDAWHDAFDPVNRSNLLLISSSGGPDYFDLSGPLRGTTWDVPPSEPVAVVMYHSFSAANPRDPNTIAGRWLAGGAFAYFGSVHEPYVQSFRTPTLLADLLARGLPLGAAVRMLPEEIPAFGNCWRLAYLGDPLFRLDPEPPRRRLERWAVLDGWKAYDAPGAPPPPGDPFAAISWAVRATIDAARSGVDPPEELVSLLQKIDPDTLDGTLREFRDLLLADSLSRLDRPDDLRAVLADRPTGELSPSARRWLESAQVSSIHRALASGDWDRAAGTWSELASSTPPGPLLKAMIDRVRPAAEGRQDRLQDWNRRLLAARRGLSDQPALVKILDEELAKLGGDAG
ncbi:hypothetical protein [Tautonia sociabilis]|uniref:TIGR03790 family protein n=1 Tax=Tautonia sociabilis TaxID=2080755 RepID=A0A432MQI6_9BACT|nr:hypothetical protein [Tautonia sociabilis]RUL89751.1 hypothetical protein TsocGM_00885 [Tautonia sociabilis]